jgi:hypothetical protein
MSRKPKGTPNPDVISRAVVRHLVERNEAAIADLRRQLAAALRDAEEAERRISARPEGVSIPPAAAGDAGNGGGVPDSGPDRRPRTTVVSRPRSPAAGHPPRP